MKKLALALGAVVLLAGAAQAQSPAPSAPPPPPHAQPAPPPFDPDAVRKAEAARLATVRTELKLSAEQEKAWPQVEAAVKRYNENRLDNVLKSRERRPSSDPMAALEERIENISAMANSMRDLVAGMKPLYAMLNDEQKRRLMTLSGPVAPPQPRPTVAPGQPLPGGMPQAGIPPRPAGAPSPLPPPSAPPPAKN